MNAPTCSMCARTLLEGESVWAEDWKVIDVSGTAASIRAEVRYTCDDCVAVAS